MSKNTVEQNIEPGSETEGKTVKLTDEPGLVTDLRKNVINPSRQRASQTFSRLTKYLKHLQSYYDTYVKVSGKDKAYTHFLALCKEKNGSNPADFSGLSRVWRAWRDARNVSLLFLAECADESALWYASANVDRIVWKPINPEDGKKAGIANHVDLIHKGQSVTRSQYLEAISEDVMILAEKLTSDKDSPRKLTRSDLDDLVVTFASSLLTKGSKALDNSRIARTEHEVKNVIASVINPKVAKKELTTDAARDEFEATLKDLAGHHGAIEIAPKGQLADLKETASVASHDATMWQLMIATIHAEGQPRGLTEEQANSLLTIAKITRQFLSHVNVDLETGETTISPTGNGHTLIHGSNGGLRVIDTSKTIEKSEAKS
jgi:hypothetical protein